MSTCTGNNATPPGPAIAPGVEAIDPARVAREIGERGGSGAGRGSFSDGAWVDPRVLAAVPSWGGDAGPAPFFQAGLAGYSDAAMRIVARRHGSPFCVTEALLDRGLLGGGRGFDKADLDLLRQNVPGGEEDHPLAGQIIGSDPFEMAAAAIKMIEQGSRHDKEYRSLAYRDRPAAAGMRIGGSKAAPISSSSAVSPRSSPEVAAEAERTFAAVDVNLACPVKKIDRKARGGHWLTEPEGAIEILRAVRSAVPPSIPCTVKLRRSYDDAPEMAERFEWIFAAAYELGYAWATVHARTVAQKYVGPSRWTFLRDLVARYPDRVIFGSGDVWEAPDIFRMIAYTGVQAVSVARGAIGNPWIFREARQMMRGLPPAPPTIGEQREVLLEHFRLSVALNGEHAAARMMRKFGIKFAQHHPRPREVEARMIEVKDLAEWRAVVDDLYDPEGAAQTTTTTTTTTSAST